MSVRSWFNFRNRYPKSKYYMHTAYRPGLKIGKRYNRTQMRLARLEKKVKASELKTHDVSVTDAAVDNAGTVTYLNGISQGDQSLDREGLKINLTKIYGKILLSGNAAGTVSTVRCILFRDKDNQGALPVTADVLESAAVYALFKHENRNRFYIHYDKTFIIGPENTTENVGFKKMITINAKVPKKGITIYYGGTGNGIADAGENAMFWLVISDTGVNQPAIAGSMRLRYYG